MPVYYLAVRKTLVESKKCIMTNLALIKTTKVVILASKFFLPIRPFADKADKVLKKTEAALKLQDKITVILSMNRMEGVAKKNLRKVETVKTKMKKVEDYVKKATTAAKKAKKMWELVVKHAPKAGAASQVKADEAATGATNLADPIVDLLKSINANTKNMYANLATVATAVKIAQGPIDVYKSAICKPKEAIQKILNIIKPFVDKLESKKCIPCTCLGGMNAKTLCIPTTYRPCPVWNNLAKLCVLTRKTCRTTPAVPCVNSLPGCKNNNLCTSFKQVLQSGSLLWKVALTPVKSALQPLVDRATSFVPDVPMPTLTIRLPYFSALDTINFDFEVESLTKFADMTLNVDMNFLDEANIVRTLGDCTLPQFLRPSSIASCPNDGLADTAKGTAMRAAMNALRVVTTQEKAKIPAAVTAVAPIVVPGVAVDDPTCVDDDENCEAWASIGECAKNPGAMHVNCKKSCSTCKTPATTPAATGGGGAIAAVIIILLLIAGVIGGGLYMREEKGPFAAGGKLAKYNPFAAGGKLAEYAQKGGEPGCRALPRAFLNTLVSRATSKTAPGGAKTSPMQSADPVEKDVVKDPAAAADAAAVGTKDTAAAVEVRGCVNVLLPLYILCSPYTTYIHHLYPSYTPSSHL